MTTKQTCPGINECGGLLPCMDCPTPEAFVGGEHQTAALTVQGLIDILTKMVPEKAYRKMVPVQVVTAKGKHRSIMTINHDVDVVYIRTAK